VLPHEQKKGEGSHGGADAEHPEADAPPKGAACANCIQRDAKDYWAGGTFDKANARIDGHYRAPIALIRTRDLSRGERRADARDRMP
jgi:hypothetical protein